MINFTVPAPVRKLTDRFKDQAGSGQWMALASMFLYFLNGSSNLCDLARYCPWTPSVSSLSRFVKEFDGNRPLRRMRGRVLRLYIKKYGELNPNNFVFAVDDTNNPKFGRSYRAGTWFGSKGLYHGQRIVVLALVDIVNDQAIPLCYRIATKPGLPDYQPCYSFVLEMLKELKNEGFPILHVVFDCWFDNSTFISDVRSLGFEATWEIKSSRKVKTSVTPWAPWKKLPQAYTHLRRFRLRNRMEAKAIKSRKKRGPCGSQLRLFIKKFEKRVNCIACYNRRNSKNAFAYWASTDLTLSETRIWELGRARWRIEKLFRELKQLLSFGRLPSSSKEAAELSICLPFIIYASLQLEPEIWGKQEEATTGDLIQRARSEAMLKSLTLAVKRPKPDRVLVRFSARTCTTRVNKKPVNRLADEPDRMENLQQKVS